MGRAVSVVAAIAVTAATGGTFFGLSVFASSLLAGGLSLGTSLLSQALTPKPKANFSAADRSLMIKQAIAPRRIILGRVRTSGVLTFAQRPDNNTYLHIVLTLSGHKLDRLDELMFDDEVVPLDATGAATGKYAGLVWAKFGNGTDTGDQALHDDLRSWCSNWTVNHKQTGCGKIYVRMKRDQTKFPNGLPNISVVVRGWPDVYDPRTGTSGWTDNAALCFARYLTASVDIGGAGWPYSAIDETVLIAAANACDEMVTLSSAATTFTAATTDQLTVSDKTLNLRTGMRVQVSTTGTLPGGLVAATNYYWIATGGLTGKLATSLANARAGTAIDLTTVGSGTHTITRNAEPRYTVNGDIVTDQKPIDLIGRLMTAYAGTVGHVAGKFHMLPGVWRAPTVTLNENDLDAGFKVLAHRPKRDLVNGVKGTFVDPDGYWQPTDFPPIEGLSYLAEDNNIRAWRDVELPFTTSPTMAQRIVSIDLERNRRQISTELSCKLTAFRNKAGDVIGFSNTRLGWTAKSFELGEWKFAVREKDGKPYFGCDLSISEVDANVYAWSTANENTLPPAARTNLPDASAVAAPGAPLVTEELYVTQTGAGIKSRALLSWGAADDAFVREYQVEYKLNASTTWSIWEKTAGLATQIDDLNAGIYDFRLKSINMLGAESSYSATTTKELVGITAPPADLTDLNLVARNGQAHLSWNRHPDLDVLNGGRIRILYTPETVSPSWAGAQDIVPSTDSGVAGSATECTVPLLNGTYLAKAVDSAGNFSVNAAMVTVTNAEMIGMNAVLTINEHTAFSGAVSGMIGSGGLLKLDRAFIDTWALIDGVVDWDTEGALETDGTYTFATLADLGAVFTSRVTSVLVYEVQDTNDFLDSRTRPMDSWDTFDGSVSENVARIWLEVRTTNDNPAGSPTWSEWRRFVVGDYVARGFQFRLRVQTTDSAYQVQISELGVVIDMPDRSLSNTVTTSAGADTTVTYSPRFFGTPTPVVTINNQQAGDVLELVSTSATGFVFNIRNGGSRVVRSCNWSARSW